MLINVAAVNYIASFKDAAIMQVLAAVVLLLAVSSAAGSATVQINLKTDAITYAVIGGGSEGVRRP